MVDKTEIPLVKNEKMNEIHFEEIDIINQLNKLIKEQSNEDITKQIQKLVEHMQEHFSFEEDMMKENYLNLRSVEVSEILNGQKIPQKTRSLVAFGKAYKNLGLITPKYLDNISQ